MQRGPASSTSFPSTQHSIVEALRTDAPGARHAAIERLAHDYWRPLYRYLRRARRMDEATSEDLIQGFFLHLLERGVLESYDPARARLRTFLRLLLDRWVSNRQRDERRLKRGGGAQHLPLDFESAERGLLELADPAGPAAEDVFREEWIRTLFELALEDLRRDADDHGRSTQFTLFERYDVRPAHDGERPTYEALAREMGIAVTKVTNDLHAARRRFKGLLLGRLAELCVSEAEWREEAHELLGIDPA